MKNRITQFSVYLLVFGLLTNYAFSQFEKYYDVLPNIQNCQTGVLKQSEKDKMLVYLNKIRDLHKLPHFEYDESFQDEAMEISLISVANNTLTHTPDPSVHCYSQTGYNGGISTNLFWSGTTEIPSETSVYSWMNDQNQLELGHRRWIIDPFIKKIAFGRVDGIPFGKSQPICGMSFYYDSDIPNNPNTMGNNDFVAMPYGDYPPTLWDFNWSFLSFSVVVDKSNRLGNNEDHVSFYTTNSQTGEVINKARVEVEDESGNVTNYSIDNGKLGCKSEKYSYGIANYCYWQILGLEKLKVYKVRIYDVLVNGQKKNFSYEFAFRDPYLSKPGTCVLSQPQDEAKDVNPNVTFQWGTAQGSDYYHFQISKSEDFSPANLVYDNNQIISTFQQVTGILEPIKTYYWRIAGINDAGTGEWSPVWSFTTTTAPDPPVLSGPADNASGISKTPTLSWEASAKADSYEVNVADNPQFSSLLVNKNEITTTSYKVEPDILGPELKYYWRVRSVSNISGPSSWSSTRSFTTAAAAPAKPELVSPEQGQKGVSANLWLKWSTVPGASTYDVQVSSENQWPEWAIVVNETNIPATSFKVPGGRLELETQYYWRVRSVGPGGESEWSKNGRFTVGDASPVFDNNNLTTSIKTYPNPAEDNASLDIYVPENSFITLKVYNLIGEEIDVILNANLPKGEYIINYDCSKLPSGVYYYRLSDDGKFEAGSLNVIR